MLHQITPLVDKAREIISTSNSILLSALPAAVLAFIIPAAFRDYRSYLALGPGGLPHNVFGWLAAKLCLNPFRREMFSTDIYSRSVEEGEDAEFLDDLPQRNGERPEMGSFAVPQRQVNQLPSQQARDKLMEEYGAFIDRNSHLLDRVPSILEKHTDAAHVSGKVPLTSIAKQMKREICHIHGTSDHSIHVTLAPADCKRVIDAGWGQRFPLAGSSLFRITTLGRLPVIPTEYVLIYAPRSDEVDVVMQIVKASVCYVAGSSDLK